MHYTYNTDTEDTIPDGLLTGVTMFDGNSISYEYDFLQRLGNRTIAGKLEERYAYAPGAGENTTTTRVSTKHNLWNGSLINQFQYSYDSLDNITSVCDAHTGKRVSYTYDDQGQLLTATHTDNDTISRTEVYTYDNVGNILTFNNGITSHTYTYGDSDWKDLLTAVDGNAITYDASGNPTSYYNGYTMTWVEGRKLDTVTVNGQTYTYVYNADGQRVKKIHPDGSYIEYYVMDGTTVGESHFTATGNKTLGIRYTLDENGTVVGFTMNGVNYYFAKNLQGDVLAVYNATTNELVAQYTYDSWGNILSATGTLAETNPFRYRSYYYDDETDFYYLQSRYYDAAIGRFINADSYASTGQGTIGNNMFSYCICNPVNYMDLSGNMCGPYNEFYGGGAVGFSPSGFVPNTNYSGGGVPTFLQIDEDSPIYDKIQIVKKASLVFYDMYKVNSAWKDLKTGFYVLVIPDPTPVNEVFVVYHMVDAVVKGSYNIAKLICDLFKGEE